MWYGRGDGRALGTRRERKGLILVGLLVHTNTWLPPGVPRAEVQTQWEKGLSAYKGGMQVGWALRGLGAEVVPGELWGKAEAWGHFDAIFLVHF